MPTMHRPPSRAELLDLLTDRGIDRDEATRVLDALAELGAEPELQVRITAEDPD
jgi:hypothetical protein